MSKFTLLDLEKIISKRASAAGDTSYTASLIAKGREKCAEKMGEEAIETIIAALKDDKQALTSEAADLLYHLLVVLNVGNVSLAQVLAELEKRTSRSGLEEKASRPKSGALSGSDKS